MIMTFAELEALGPSRRRSPVGRAGRAVDATRSAIIVYTSGTTGPPKGAMLSHANLIAAADDVRRRLRRTGPDDEVLSYLPLCHVAERLVVGHRRAQARLRRELRRGRRVVRRRPARGPAHVLPRRAARVGEDAGRRRDPHGRRRRGSSGSLYRVVARRGAQAGAASACAGGLGPVDRSSPASSAGCSSSAACARSSACRRVRVALSGAAPIAPQVLEFFWALGVPVREGYGQTEGTRAGDLHARPTTSASARSGKALPGVELRIARRRRDPHAQQAASFVGYFNEREGHARRRSTPTAGCTPATSASSTPTASSPSPTARRTSSSPRAARTSRRRRSRTCSRSRPTSARRS